jgi:hypothetical protein
MHEFLDKLPELSLLLAVFLAVVFWNVIRLLLAVLAASLLLTVLSAMAAYGIFVLLAR